MYYDHKKREDILKSIERKRELFEKRKEYAKI